MGRSVSAGGEAVDEHPTIMMASTTPALSDRIESILQRLQIADKRTARKRNMGGPSAAPRWRICADMGGFEPSLIGIATGIIALRDRRLKPVINLDRAWRRLSRR